MKKYLSVVLVGMFVTVLLTLLLITPIWCGNMNPLPDTYQTKCYDISGNEITCPEKGQSLHGQDAQYFGPAPSYTSHTINDEMIVFDNNTGLTWQQDTVDANGDGHSSSLNGDCCYPSGDRMTWQQAVNYCSALSFAGYDDWRLPEYNELETIVDYNRVLPAINTIFFHVVQWRHWTATTTPYGPYSNDNGWMINFDIGTSGPSPKTGRYYVRCVRE